MLTFAVTVSKAQTTQIDSLEMRLSAYGVESDDFPCIDIMINYLNHTSHCRKWFYSPEHTDSIYSLTENDMQKILHTLVSADLEKLAKEYKTQTVDLPSSKTIVYSRKKVLTFNDYGLIAPNPLKEIYKIAYKL